VEASLLLLLFTHREQNPAAKNKGKLACFNPAVQFNQSHRIIQIVYSLSLKITFQWEGHCLYIFWRRNVFVYKQNRNQINTIYVLYRI